MVEPGHRIDPSLQICADVITRDNRLRKQHSRLKKLSRRIQIAAQLLYRFVAHSFDLARFARALRRRGRNGFDRGPKRGRRRRFAQNPMTRVLDRFPGEREPPRGSICTKSVEEPQPTPAGRVLEIEVRENHVDGLLLCSGERLVHRGRGVDRIEALERALQS